MSAVLALDDVAIRFGGVQAVGGVTRSIEAGDFVGLIGPNGAGKTTLIRIIAGSLGRNQRFLVASASVVQHGGCPVHGREPHPLAGGAKFLSGLLDQA